MSIILAIDAALGPASVAVLRGEQVLARAREDRPREQATQLAPMADAALREAGVRYVELDFIVATVGPGTFTGLRIGLALARGIGFAAGKQVAGVGTLASTAMAAISTLPKSAEGKTVLAALNAGKGEAYCQMFHVKQNIFSAKELEPRLATPEALAGLADDDTLIAGNIPPEWVAGRRFVALTPDAADAGAAARTATLLLPPTPLYVRAPDAKLQNKQ